ncbi:MAG TPA: metallophosphoesterase, partial [Kofleriaceae bacterium]|nr:metallophosphoesterase [Kofleriaceae bacterium]
WPLVRVRGELAIIGLSTSRQTPWFTAYGRVGAGQLARFEKALGDPRLAGKARLVAIHHPPAGKRAANKIRGLKDHAAFADVIGRVGCDLIVHGHEHQDLTETLTGPSGPIQVRGIASGTYHHNKPDRVARYRVFQIEGGKIVSDFVRVWTREHGMFEAQPGSGQQSNYVS